MKDETKQKLFMTVIPIVVSFIIAIIGIGCLLYAVYGAFLFLKWFPRDIKIKVYHWIDNLFNGDKNMANELAKNNQNQVENDLHSIQLLQVFFGKTAEEAKEMVEKARTDETVKAKINQLSVIVIQKMTGMSMDKACDFVAKYRDTNMATMVKAIKEIVPADRLAQAQAQAVQFLN